MVLPTITPIMLILDGISKGKQKLVDTFFTYETEMKLTAIKESSRLNKDLITIMTALTIMVCTAIIGLIVYNLNDRNNMAKNIEAAIAKGVDPLSVKCAYETQPNSVCIAYSMTGVIPGSSSGKK